MLRELYIENFALISNLRVELQTGFTVITGETGSGKSIIIDALSMCLGRRGGKEFIRRGKEKSIIELRIENISDSMRSQLQEFGIEVENQLIISRELQRDGSTVARLNGRMVPISILKNIATELITIHGQNEYESIMSGMKQLYLLDNFGKDNIAKIKKEYEQNYADYIDVLKKLEEITQYTQTGAIDRELDLMKYQINEIERASLIDGELEKLEEEKKIQVNAEKISLSVQRAYDKLYEGQGNALDLIRTSLSELEQIASYDMQLSQWKEELESIYYSLEELVNQISAKKDSFVYEEDYLNGILVRLEELKKIYHKYGRNYEGVMEYLLQMQNKITELEKREELEQAYLQEKQKKEHLLMKLAKKLSAVRQKYAEELKQKVIFELNTLNLKKVSYEIHFSEKDISRDGIDEICFMISFNEGEELKPFHKVASGGEISRFMLALKNIVSSYDEIDTLIFDEIDTGVSGIAANKIGEKLQSIGTEKQIICITHLPQIAAFGNHHLLVEKSDTSEGIKTVLKKLNTEQRVLEIAKMTVGEEITETSLRNAEELLQRNNNNY